MGRTIALLSDFGWSDSYVAVLKGTIAQVNPTLTIIDITHQIPPQNIGLGRFALLTAVPYFPLETVHVAIVDPGVGSKRRAIAIGIANQLGQPVGFLVGPDNGIFSGVFAQFPAYATVELTNPQFWRVTQPSATFHGRDIFAPVAAHLASGVPLSDLGTAIATESLVQFALPSCVQTENRIDGCIQAIDHFGNLITNIPGANLVEQWCVMMGDQSAVSAHTYSDCSVGNLISLVGSHGWLEIAVNSGSAQTRLDAKIGDLVEVQLQW